MDWLRNNSFIGRSQSRSILNSTDECDPSACYDSFKEHWQQVLKIIQRTKQLPSHDDVLGVVNHLEQMVTLLLFDVKKIDQITLPIATTSHCLEYLLAENILDKLFEWGMRTGKYTNAVRLEQLKLYEMLISQSRHLLLVHEPFLRPMIKLLQSCQGEVFHKDVEKRLVGLLYQLCVLLMQNVDLIDLFFIKENTVPKFVIFALLIPYVHREGETGMQARDALLLCMSLSKRNKNVATYIAENSSMCPLLATGLSGLYSILPNVLNDIKVPDWHRLTPDDVNDIKDLSAFVTSLEFSNAVAQIAHPIIRKQLQEFLYKGFLIPVLGPALLQTTLGEQIAATAYLELILRTVTQPGLLHPLLQFLLQVQYDGQRLLEILIQRISAEQPLCMVSLALFELMVDVNCEDFMLELVFQHLQPCLHLMLSQRRMLTVLDPHCRSFEKFLSLAPACCDVAASPKIGDSSAVQWNHYGGRRSLYGNYHAYLCDARNKITGCQIACSFWSNSYMGGESQSETNLDDNNPNSLPSLGESSGYESLKIKTDDGGDEKSFLPVWQISQHVEGKACNGRGGEEAVQLSSAGTAGPFLTTVLEKLKNFLSNSFYTNLHLTGLISRLAVYPQPLLRTYLLDHSLVLQPNVPSLYQIIGSLKQKIDEYMLQKPDYTSLIRYARHFLLERETRLVNARRTAVEKTTTTTPAHTATEPSDPFQRNGPKRRSLNLSSISNMFGRRHSHVEAAHMQMLMPMEEAQQVQIYPKFTEAQHVALCAVLLDEWVKELAALAQEHTIAQLATILK